MKQRELSIAKITRPRITGVYERKRLFKLLDQGRDKPVVWISGPAGSGKTTLAASWLDARKLPCIWYQLDEGDSDPATFFYYLGLAAKKAAPRYKHALPLLTPEYLPSVSVFSKRYFESLCLRLSPPFVLVFDNYQTVSADSLLHDAFREGITALPEGVRVVVISRTEPPHQFVPLLAAQRLTTIGWEDLKLAPEESKGIIRSEAGHALTRAAIDQMHEKAHGWAAGLILMTKQAQSGKGVVPDHLEHRPPKEVFDYFASELFDRAEPQIREFLLKTAYLPKITIEAAQKLTGLREADRVLAGLYRGNYFTGTRHQSERVYEYHPLFREFLMERAGAVYAPATITALQTTAAGILEASGQTEDAVELLRRAGALERMTGLILQSAPEMVGQGRWRTLKSWIESFPNGIVERQPWLIYWLSVCDLPFSPTESNSTFKKAFDLFKVRKDSAGLFLSLSGMFDSVAFNFNNFIEYDHLIPLLYDLRAEFTEYPSREIESRIVGSMLYALYVRQPQHPDLEYWMARGSALAKSISDINGKAYILLMQALIRLYAGELEKTAVILDSLRKAVLNRHVTPSAMVILRDLEVNYTWLAAEFDKNHNTAAEGIAQAIASGVHTLDVFIFGNGAAGALSIGEMKRAEQLLNGMRARLDSRAMSWGENLYHNLAAWKCLLQQDLKRASLHADQAIAFGTQSGAVPTEAYQYLIKAIVMHELKNDSEASLHIAKVRGVYQAVNMYQTKFRALLAEAQFAFGRGGEAAGLALLRQAMALGRERGYYNAIFWVPSEIAKLCVKALEAGIEVDYVRGLIHRRNLIPEDPLIHVENWPWPYRISAMGAFRIVTDDKPLRLPAKMPKKPLELLKALIASGGTDVSEERITDALWPDAPGDAAHSSFTTTLQRLRRLLGNDKVIVVQDGRVSIDRRSVWVDAWAFERVVESSPDESVPGQAACGVRSDGYKLEILQRLEKALQLYTGHFLSGDGDKPWAISMRERLRTRYLRAVGMLGAIHEQAGKYAKAVEVYQRGLDVDDLAEEFYQRLMECYKNMGKRSEAVRVYERCRKTLKAALGVEPGDGTTALYRKITR